MTASILPHGWILPIEVHPFCGWRELFIRYLIFNFLSMAHRKSPGILRPPFQFPKTGFLLCTDGMFTKIGGFFPKSSSWSRFSLTALCSAFYNNSVYHPAHSLYFNLMESFMKHKTAAILVSALGLSLLLSSCAQPESTPSLTPFPLHWHRTALCQCRYSVCGRHSLLFLG